MKIPRRGDMVRMTHLVFTIDEEENQVPLPIGETMRVEGVGYIPTCGQGLQFELIPLRGGLSSIFVDESDFDCFGGSYPFEFSGS